MAMKQANNNNKEEVTIENLDNWRKVEDRPHITTFKHTEQQNRWVKVKYSSPYNRNPAAVVEGRYGIMFKNQDHQESSHSVRTHHKNPRPVSFDNKEEAEKEALKFIMEE